MEVPAVTNEVQRLSLIKVDRAARVERAFRIGLQVTVAPASTYRSRIPRSHGRGGFSPVRLPHASQTQVCRIGRGTLQEASNPRTAQPITVR